MEHEATPNTELPERAEITTEQLTSRADEIMELFMIIIHMRKMKKSIDLKFRTFETILSKRYHSMKQDQLLRRFLLQLRMWK